MTSSRPAPRLTAPSRRALVGGAAWAVPAAVLASAAPAFAASTACPAKSWYARSLSQITAPDWTNNGFLDIHNSADGAMKFQHFSLGPGILTWRLMLLFEESLPAGSVTLTIPKDPTWAGMPAQMDYVAWGTELVAGHTVEEWFYKGYTRADGSVWRAFWPALALEHAGVATLAEIPEDRFVGMPQPTIAIGADAIVVTWADPIPPGSMGIIQFGAPALGGNAAMEAGDQFYASGTMDFADRC